MLYLTSPTPRLAPSTKTSIDFYHRPLGLSTRLTQKGKKPIPKTISINMNNFLAFLLGLPPEKHKGSRKHRSGKRRKHRRHRDQKSSSGGKSQNPTAATDAPRATTPPPRPVTTTVPAPATTTVPAPAPPTTAALTKPPPSPAPTVLKRGLGDMTRTHVYGVSQASTVVLGCGCCGGASTSPVSVLNRRLGDMTRTVIQGVEETASTATAAAAAKGAAGPSLNCPECSRLATAAPATATAPPLPTTASGQACPPDCPTCSSDCPACSVYCGKGGACDSFYLPPEACDRLEARVRHEQRVQRRKEKQSRTFWEYLFCVTPYY